MVLTKVVRLRPKGQLTIPREMRDALDLHVGEPLVISLHGDSLVLARHWTEGAHPGGRFVRDARALVGRMVAERGGKYLPDGTISATLAELRGRDEE